MRYLILICLCFNSAFAFSQVDTVARIFTFGGLNNDVGEEIQATSDGGYIVIGSTSSNSWGNTDAYLLKVDSNCNYLWSTTLGGVNNDWGYSIKETHDKGFVIAASSNSYGNGGYDACLMKRDSLGNYQWTKCYGGNDWDFAYSVAQTYDSGYVFCGESYTNSNGFSDVYIVRTNATGDTLWTKKIGGPSYEKGNSIIETTDSCIVVAGIKETVIDSTEMYVIKLDKNGTLLWDSIYGDSLYEFANQIIEVNTGNYVIAGNTSSNSAGGDQNYLIKSIDPNGNLLWDFTIINGPVPTPDDEDAMGIIQLPDNRLLITGYSRTGGSKKNIIFFHLDTFGNWAGESNVMGSNSDDDYLQSITIGANGEIVCAGVSRSLGVGQDDVILVKMDTLYNGQDTAVTNYNDTTPLFIKENKNDGWIKLFPNPVEDYLTVNVSEGKSVHQLSVIDMTGRIVISRNDAVVLDLSLLKAGLYQVRVELRDGSSYFSKIVKK